MAVNALEIDQHNLLQEENRRLKHAVEELSILNELARAIGASVDLQEIIGTIVRKSLRAVNAEQGVIHLVDPRAVDPMKTLVREMASIHDHEQFRLNQTLVGWMQLNKKPLLMNSPLSDPRFSGLKWDESIHSLLSVPMVIKSQLKGILSVYNKKGGAEFTDDDQRLLAIIAGQSAQVIENARLNEREKQLLKMQEELRLAARIQEELLPKSAPTIQGYDIAGMTIPAQSVGGDYFDFIPMNQDRLGICLGDVSGKGLPAALLMANTQATLRSHAFMDLTPQECTFRSNRLLLRSTDSEKYVTLFYGVLDTLTHALCYVNAGHEHPIRLSSSGEFKSLHIGGIMLGMVEDFPFQEESVPFGPGDVLVAFSDGVTEAMNVQQEQFGGQRLQQVILEHQHETSAVLIESIFEAVKEHAGAVPQMDDITIVVVKRDAS